VRAYGAAASALGVELENAGGIEAGGGELRLCPDAAEAGRAASEYDGWHHRPAAIDEALVDYAET
jgi:hypothetical protein